MARQTKDFYEFGDFRVDAVERVLQRRGELMPLTPKVFDLLLLLVENHGHVVEKERLMHEVWPETFVEEGNLTQNISLLRKILKDDHHQYIQTVPRRGYRFVGHVSKVLDGDAELVVEEHSRARVVIEEEPEPAIRSSSPTPGSPAGQPGWGGAAREAWTNEQAKLSPSVPTAELQVSRVSAASRRSRRVTVGAILIMLLMSLTGALVLRGFRSHRTTAPAFSLDNYSWEKLSADDKTGGAISPDGEFLVYRTGVGVNGSWSLKQRRLASLETVTILPQMTSTSWGGALSHDSSFVYYILADRNDITGTLYKVSVLGGTPRKILEQINGGPSLSPDDSRVAFIRFSFKPGVSALITADANDGSDERVLEESDAGPELFNPAWSPDGLRIVCMKSDKRPDGVYWSLVEIPATGGPVKQFTEPKKQHLWSHTWLLDGTGLITVATDPLSAKQQLYFISYPDGSMQRITNDLYNYAGISISSDGNRLVTNQQERQTEVWVAAATEVNRANQIGICCVDSVSWTPDGRIVYDAVKEGRVHLWVADADGSHQQQLSPDNGIDWSPSVSRGGRYLAFLSTRSGQREIWRMDTDGRNPRQLTNYGADIRDLRLSADGQMVYFTEMASCCSRLELVRVSIDGGEPQPVGDITAELWDTSPDGKSLAYSFYDEELGRWRIAVRPVEGEGPITTFDDAPIDVLLWMPDGRSLIYKDRNQDPSTALWRQPLSGEKPQRFIDFSPETSYGAAWSNDGQHLAFVRGKVVMNILMLTRLQGRGVATSVEKR